MDKKPRTYVQEFEALRGIAVVLVVMHHIEIFHKWRVGPDIFFLLSGYLTTRSLQRRTGSNRTRMLLSFYKRRIVRLLPPLLVVLAAVLPLMLLEPRIDSDVWRNMTAALSYSINWQQALTAWESHSLAHLWSLAAEQQFYLLWPPLFLLCPRRWIRSLITLLACGAVLWRLWLWEHDASFNRIFFGLDTHADALVVGCLLAVTGLPPRLVPILRVAGPVSLLALIAAALLLPAVSATDLVVAMSVTTPLAAAVILSVELAGPFGRVLALRPLQALGRMSYSLYLWNFPIIAFVHPHWRHGEKAVQMTAIMAAASATYRWVEMPLMRHLKSRRPPVQAAERPVRNEPVLWSPAPRPS